MAIQTQAWPAHSSWPIQRDGSSDPHACSPAEHSGPSCLLELPSPINGPFFTYITFVGGAGGVQELLAVTCGHQEQLHPFNGSSHPLRQHSFLTSPPKENILILLWKSPLPTIPGLDFLEGRAGVRIDLLCKCVSGAFLLQGTIAHFGRKQGTAPNRLKSYLLSLCAVQPWNNYLLSRAAVTLPLHGANDGI